MTINPQKNINAYEAWFRHFSASSKNSSSKKSEEKFKQVDVTQVKLESAEDLKIASEIKHMKAWENHVIAHEHMHMLAGGSAASSPTYVYKMGPDGKMYVTGGEVSLRIPKASSLEGTEAALKKMKNAALAPGDPSSKDLNAAGLADALIDKVRAMIHQKKQNASYEKTLDQENELKLLKGQDLQPIEKIKFSQMVTFELMI